MADPTEKEVTPQAPAPTEQPEHPLDEMFKVEEAEITKLLEHPLEDTSTTTPAGSPPLEPGKEAAPAAETVPVAEPAKETPPAEKPPPVEAKPAERKETKGPTWKQLREMKRELEEERRKLQEAEKRIAASPAETIPEGEPEIEDPLTMVSKETKATKEGLQQTREELERIKAAEAQRLVVDEIKVDEERFKKEGHADYDEALNFLAEKRLSHYDRTGRIDRYARLEMQGRPELVREFAEKSGRNPDDDTELYDAARDMVGRILIHADRMNVIQDCRETGKSVAEVAWGLSLDFGYKPKDAEPAALATPAKSLAQERVERAKEQKPQEQSLSAMQSSGKPQQRRITTRQQLLDMDTAEREKYIFENDQRDPFWDRDLT